MVAMQVNTQTPTKTCSKCKRELPATLEFFHKKMKSISPMCKNCKREYSKKLRIESRDKDRERQKKWYMENTDKVMAASIKWKRKNPDKVREIRKKYRMKNRDKLREENKKYRMENPDKVIKNELKREGIIDPPEEFVKTRVLLRTIKQFIKHESNEQQGTESRVNGSL